MNLLLFYNTFFTAQSAAAVFRRYNHYNTGLYKAPYFVRIIYISLLYWGESLLFIIFEYSLLNTPLYGFMLIRRAR